MKKGSFIHKEVVERYEKLAGTDFTRGDYAVAVKVGVLLWIGSIGHVYHSIKS